MSRHISGIALIFLVSGFLFSCEEEPVIEDVKEVFCYLESIQDGNGNDILRLSYDGNSRVTEVMNEEGTTAYPSNFWSNVEGSSATQTS